ncbi:MAG: hypothetical protein CMP20_15510 [Rickettsiales bacterium]|nr:hypothetical protein [Rickettsiales bacterium]
MPIGAEALLALIGEQTRKRRRGLDDQEIDVDVTWFTWDKLAEIVDLLQDTPYMRRKDSLGTLYKLDEFFKDNFKFVVSIVKYNQGLQASPGPNESFSRVLLDLESGFQKGSLWNMTKDESLTLTLFRYGLFNEDWARTYVYAQAFDDDRLQEIRKSLEFDEDGELDERYINDPELLRNDMQESRLQEDLYPEWYDQMVLAGPEEYERMVQVIKEVFGDFARWNRKDSLEESN